MGEIAASKGKSLASSKENGESLGEDKVDKDELTAATMYFEAAI